MSWFHCGKCGKRFYSRYETCPYCEEVFKPLKETEEFSSSISKYPLEQIAEDYRQGMSLPKIHRKYGIAIATAHHHLAKMGIMRDLSQAMLYKAHHQVEWHKLTNAGKSQARLIGIPSSLLKKSGLNPANKLFGKWHVDKEILILELKEEENQK